MHTNDNDNEQALISALLQQPEYYVYIQNIIKSPEYFRDKNYRSIYTIMIDMYIQGQETWDTMIVAGKLQKSNKLEKIGGHEGLFNIYQFYLDHNEKNIKKIATLISEDYCRYKINEECIIIQDKLKSNNNQNEVHDLLNATIDNLHSLQKILDHETTTYNLKEIAVPVFKQIELISQGKCEGGLSTGFGNLDDYLFGGIQNTDMVIVGARPSGGKTTFVLSMAYNIALKKKNVLYLSLETSKESLLRDRLIPSITSILSSSLRQGNLDEKEWNAMFHKAEDFSLQNFRINDSSNNTIEQLKSIIEAEIKEYDTDLIVIDYIQLVYSNIVTKNRVEELTKIAEILRQLIKKYKIPIILAAQLNRESEKEGREPKKSDIKECGSLEEKADVIMLLHSDKESPNEIKVIIEKNRNAITGDTILNFDKKITKLSEPSTIEPYEG